MNVADARARGSLQQRPLAERIDAALMDAERHPASGFPESFTYRQLARIADGQRADEATEPTRSRLSSVRRAVAKLVNEGRAERVSERRMDGEGQHRRSSGYVYRNPGGVEIRRAMTEADHAAREAALRPCLLRMEAEAAATDYAVDTGYGGVVNVAVEPALVIDGEAGTVELRQERA